MLGKDRKVILSKKKRPKLTSFLDVSSATGAAAISTLDILSSKEGADNWVNTKNAIKNFKIKRDVFETPKVKVKIIKKDLTSE